MKWTTYTSSKDGRLVMFSKHLLKWRGHRIDLHRICAADSPGFFHSHPANAFRIVLCGSYTEELFDGTKRAWRPGMMGFVPGPMLHRLDAVKGPCFTLWFRGRDQFKIGVVQKKAPE